MFGSADIELQVPYQIRLGCIQYMVMEYVQDIRFLPQKMSTKTDIVFELEMLR